MRTITLELLRHGPAHNQLLSPLTPYLALCQNHAAVTLHVPFEHNQFLHRLSALGYKVSEEARVFQLNDTAKVLGDFLGEIPGLLAESNKEDNGKANPLTHLRLIISSSELALLPFELALSPNGLPGAGQHLLLQPQMPLCLTRETRRVPDEQLMWPKKPRILFIAAAPPQRPGEPRPAIPIQSHLLAMRRAISPWVWYFDKNDVLKRREKVEEHLHFLPEASIEAIEHACASGSYTHVHILAHGIQVRENYDTRFYLALHDAQDPDKPDFVSGARLATALRASHRTCSSGIARPVVVTLASCDSGNVGSVAGAGASVAHALHESGIPMVVAGQFPLSFEGSVRILECLYEGLLWGADPRPLLSDLRRRLFSQFPKTHDWASLTAYVALPPDFDNQLPEVQIDRAARSIDAALNHADEVTRRFFDLTDTDTKKSESGESVLKSARKKIDDAKKKLELLLDCWPAQRASIYGKLASTEKRNAEVLFSAAKRPKKISGAEAVSDSVRDFDADASVESLRKSRDYYWRSFVTDRTQSWAVAQYLSLSLVMENSPLFPDERRIKLAKEGDEQQEENNLADLWLLAWLHSNRDLHSESKKNANWAHGDLIELYLLSLIMPESKNLKKREDVERQALGHTDALLELAGPDSFEAYSTRRQIFRYIGWFSEISVLGEEFTKLAQKIFEKFPRNIEQNFRKSGSI
jgi:hypothetical protein